MSLVAGLLNPIPVRLEKDQEPAGGINLSPLYIYVPGAQTACRMHLQYFFIYEGYNYEDISPTIETIYPYSTEKIINMHEAKFVKHHEKMTLSDFFIFTFFSTHGAFEEFSSDHLAVLQIFKEYC